MIRALSTNRTRRHGYDKLMDHHQLQPSFLQTDDDHDEDEDVSKVKLKRVTSLPTWKTFGSMKHVPQPTPDVAPPAVLPVNFPTKSVKKVRKTHPFFGLFDLRNKKKATSKPEFGRYLEYLKEGGMWDANTNQPVMHFK